MHSSATQEVQGTGMGEGGTRGAKDVSDKIDNEDQLLGAQQKEQEEREEQPKDQQDEGGEDKVRVYVRVCVCARRCGMWHWGARCVPGHAA